MSEYAKRARAFCQRCNLTIRTEYVGHTTRLSDQTDAVPTAQFRVTFEREGRKPWTFDFNTSIRESYQWADTRGNSIFLKWGALPGSLRGKVEFDTHRRPEDAERRAGETGQVQGWAGWGVRRTVNPPSEYDVLACVGARDPGTFEEFCSDFGYSEDSIRARETYFAVQREWSALQRMFSPEELEALAEIQ